MIEIEEWDEKYLADLYIAADRNIIVQDVDADGLSERLIDLIKKIEGRGKKPLFNLKLVCGEKLTEYYTGPLGGTLPGRYNNKIKQNIILAIHDDGSILGAY